MPESLRPCSKLSSYAVIFFVISVDTLDVRQLEQDRLKRRGLTDAATRKPTPLRSRRLGPAYRAKLLSSLPGSPFKSDGFLGLDTVGLTALPLKSEHLKSTTSEPKPRKTIPELARWSVL